MASGLSLVLKVLWYSSHLFTYRGLVKFIGRRHLVRIFLAYFRSSLPVSFFFGAFLLPLTLPVSIPVIRCKEPCCGCDSHSNRPSAPPPHPQTKPLWPPTRFGNQTSGASSLRIPCHPGLRW